VTISKSAADGLLRAVAFLHPGYAPLIDFLEAHEDALVAAGPVINEAAKEGPGALAAAETAAPGLTQAIKHFIESSPVATYQPKLATMHAENITRRIVGAPVLTEDQEHDFLSEDSRSGSG
jgi:hypothetical protein